MSSAKNNVANAVGGKTARACDSCITKRARWYCAADDAFLCQACDSSVHSANPLARRHERVRLKTASSYKPSSTSDASAADQQQLIIHSRERDAAPSWHRGITKKARTPRHGGKRQTAAKSSSSNHNHNNPFHLVPEEGSDEVNSSHEENEEQLLYRVPVFDPFVAEVENNNNKGSDESKVGCLGYNNNKSNNNHVHHVDGLIIPSDVELAEFAADVETLLGRGMENECVGMEELGLIDNNNKEEEYSWECSVGSDGKKVKVEQQEEGADPQVVGVSDGGCNKIEEMEMEMEREPLELSFDDYEDDEVKEKAAVVNNMGDLDVANSEEGHVKENEEDGVVVNKKRKILLQLDYEGVISAWGSTSSSPKSPWTTGHKPDLDPDVDHCWPYCMGTCGTQLHQYPYGYGEMVGYGCHQAGMGDGGREARVSRYREKRRTRLFSKKIRYEVRKLNAEKRPRMKGRFVKRASFAVSTTPTFPLAK